MVLRESMDSEDTAVTESNTSTNISGDGMRPQDVGVRSNRGEKNCCISKGIRAALAV